MSEISPKPGETRSVKIEAIVAILKEAEVGTKITIESVTPTGEVISVTIMRTEDGIKPVKD